MNENDAYIEHLENTIKDLQNQVSNLTEMVLLLRKEKFGSSSEKTPKQIEGQLSLYLYSMKPKSKQMQKKKNQSSAVREVCITESRKLPMCSSS